MLDNLLTPGELVVIFGDYGTGKTTLALQALRRGFSAAEAPPRVPAFWISTQPMLPVRRLRAILELHEDEDLVNFLRVFKVRSFVHLKRFLLTLELVLDEEVRARTGTAGSSAGAAPDAPDEVPTGAPYPPLVFDSFTRPYLLETGSTEKNYKIHRQLSLACAWLKQLALAKRTSVLLVCEERVKREEGQVQKIVPAAENVLMYWADRTCNVRRGEALQDRRLVFTEQATGRRREANAHLGGEGFESL